ncbi:hypothetical protein [Chryseobacterium scophthalmum]|uniref:hypothetical protein n=1 Tax=Chryseobacterium scophthalmum TaxID=59733 RepID=UPI001AEC4519|nr:hypothetical protein [Chryseobacterium scophthalmum]
MNNLNREEYSMALEGWIMAKQDIKRIAELFPPNYVFNLSPEQVQWLKKNNSNKEFCVEIGVIKGQLTIILCPLDEKGTKVAVGEFPYCTFEALESDLKLTEVQTYTVVKNALLSKDMRKIDNDSDMFFPITSQPIMEQDKALNSIESWQSNGQDWFYAQYKEDKARTIFNKFYVPSEKICHADADLSFVCSFGLKYSEIYQKQLPALIFIAFHKNLGNGGSVETISNTYDYAKPCPPICKIPDLGTDE